MNADATPAGRDLDELIHTGVLGWKWDVDAASGGPVGGQIGPAVWVRGSETLPYDRVPRYSTDAVTALNMLHEAFPAHSHTPERVSDITGPTTVTIRGHSSTADSFALAACRAALKAKGVA